MESRSKRRSKSQPKKRASESSSQQQNIRIKTEAKGPRLSPKKRAPSTDNQRKSAKAAGYLKIAKPVVRKQITKHVPSPRIIEDVQRDEIVNDSVENDNVHAKHYTFEGDRIKVEPLHFSDLSLNKKGRISKRKAEGLASDILAILGDNSEIITEIIYEEVIPVEQILEVPVEQIYEVPVEHIYEIPVDADSQEEESACAVELSVVPDAKPVAKRSVSRPNLISVSRCSSDNLTCGNCLETFPARDDLFLHYATYLVGDSHNCEVCDMQIQQLDKFHDHLTMHAMEPICLSCKERFPSGVKLQAHIDITHRYKCDMCYSFFTYKPELTSHLKMVHRSKVRECMDCGMVFKTNAGLHAHRLALHKKDGRPTCYICNQIFYDRCSLSRHMHTHVDARPFECTECGMAFKQKSYLVDHMCRHTGIWPHVCQICGQGFGRKRPLLMHIRKHMEADPRVHSILPEDLKEVWLTCELCPKQFNSRQKLNTHMKSHSQDRPYVCKVCRKGFKFSSHLVVHERIHTGERPSACPFCDKCFKTNYVTKLHIQKEHIKVEKEKVIKLHLNEDMSKRYECELCLKRFNFPSRLSKHMLVHSKDRQKEFYCDICDKFLGTLFSLQRHLEKVHSGEGMLV